MWFLQALGVTAGACKVQVFSLVNVQALAPLQCGRLVSALPWSLDDGYSRLFILYQLRKKKKDAANNSNDNDNGHKKVKPIT